MSNGIRIILSDKEQNDKHLLDIVGSAHAWPSWDIMAAIAAEKEPTIWIVTPHAASVFGKINTMFKVTRGVALINGEYTIFGSDGEWTGSQINIVRKNTLESMRGYREY